MTDNIQTTSKKNLQVVVVSGFFNPLHGGHLDMIEAAASLGDRLIVIVNNDKQQLQKKGRIILDESNRLRLIKSLRRVDEAILSIDDDMTVIRTLEKLAIEQPTDNKLVFANGGDRSSKKVVPEAEICKQYGIGMVFGVGGVEKSDSSTRIINWNNKQIDYVIGEKDESDITVLRKYLPEDEARHIRDRNYARNFLRAEQRQRAERNKLKESSDE